MGYYVRVLGESNSPISVEELRAGLDAAGIAAELAPAERTGDWKELTLRHRDGTEIALISKDLVGPGTLGEEEIEEFLEEISGCLPSSAARWLAEYLPTVKVIYAFQLLGGVDQGPGWDALGELREKIWNATGGIMQADGEGFSNPDGYHILWQFSDSAQGSWAMAVLLSLAK